jgi:Tfp pilus assembly protein PilN
MLRTNLSTRPFYNERGVHGLLGVLALVVAAFTIFNVVQIVLLSQRQSQLSSRAEAAEIRAAELRAQAARTRQAVNTKQLEQISNAATEVNGIIDQRLFSWTDLLNRLSATLPENVRIGALRPQIERDERVTVQMTVIGRSVEDVAAFMKNLEETAAFSDVFASQDNITEDGLVEAVVEGAYVPAP